MIGKNIYLVVFAILHLLKYGYTNTSSILNQFDENINTILTNPQPGQGDHLLKVIDDYTCILWEIRNEIRKFNVTVIEDLKSVVTTRLPEFVRTYRRTDKSEISKIFHWGDRKEKRLNYLVLDSKHLWKTTFELLQRRMNELRNNITSEAIMSSEEVSSASSCSQA
jgi:hypothetical protein